MRFRVKYSKQYADLNLVVVPRAARDFMPRVYDAAFERNGREGVPWRNHLAGL